MTNVPNSIATELLTSTPAANDDRIDESSAPLAPVLRGAGASGAGTGGGGSGGASGWDGGTGGWDAHEVWRRTIKEARDRRRSDPPPEF